MQGLLKQIRNHINPHSSTCRKTVPSSIVVPYDSNSVPLLCKDCKHFRKHPTFADDLKLGYCAKRASIHLVDGHVINTYAELIRTFDCHGDWWEPGSDDK